MEGKSPVDIAFSENVRIELIQIILGKEAAGIGFALPFLVKGVVNIRIGILGLDAVVENTESLDLGADIVFKVGGRQVIPLGTGVDFITDDPVVHLCHAVCTGIVLAEEGGNRSQMLYTGRLRRIKRITSAGKAVSGIRMLQIGGRRIVIQQR